MNQKYKLKLGWADVAQKQYCRNVRENLTKKKGQKLAKISAKMFAKNFHKLQNKRKKLNQKKNY